MVTNKNTRDQFLAPAERLLIAIAAALLVITACLPSASGDRMSIEIRAIIVIAGEFAMAASTCLMSRWKSHIRVLTSFVLGFLLYQAAGRLATLGIVPLQDRTLIRIDRWMLGGDVWNLLASVMTPRPAFVEALQWAYTLYYLIPIFVAVQMFRMCGDVALEEFRFTLLGALGISFLGYILVPAVGPRFMLFEFAHLRQDLPGLFATDWFRSSINSGEGITATMTSAEAIRYVLRDTFPSGHTLIVLLSAYFAQRYRVRGKTVVVTLAAVVIFSTLYLRYHYLIDILVSGTVVTSIAAYYRWIEFRSIRMAWRNSQTSRIPFPV